MARSAVVEQRHAAVHAEVGGRVRSRRRDRPLAAGADSRRHSLERLLVVESPAALGLRLLLYLGAACHVASHGADDVEAGKCARDDADAIAHISAVAGQVRHQLDEESKERKEHKAPEEGPVLAAPPADHEPRRDEQQRQRDDEPDGKDAELLPEPCALVPATRRGFQRGLPLALCLESLIDAEQLGVETLGLRLCGALTRLELIKLGGSAQHLRILSRIGGGDPRGDPVVEALAARPVGVRCRRVGESRALLSGGEVALDPVERVAHRGDPCGLRRIHVLLDRDVLPHARKLADDLAAQTDEEAGEDERDDPGGELKESFGDAQALEHGR